MNERIEELVKRCETLDGDEDGYFTRFDKEKFAKLIAQECVKICVDNGESYARHWDLTSNLIKKHFGLV